MSEEKKDEDFILPPKSRRKIKILEIDAYLKMKQKILDLQKANSELEAERNKLNETINQNRMTIDMWKDEAIYEESNERSFYYKNEYKRLKAENEEMKKKINEIKRIIKTFDDLGTTDKRDIILLLNQIEKTIEGKDEEG